MVGISPRDEALRGEIAERAVRPLGVVVLTEISDEDGRFGEGSELLAVEERMAEAFDNQFPRTGRGDIDRLNFLLHQPLLEFLRGKLRA